MFIIRLLPDAHVKKNLTRRCHIVMICEIYYLHYMNEMKNIIAVNNLLLVLIVLVAGVVARCEEGG